MSAEIPASNPEKRDLLDDNARKFTLGDISHEFLRENNAESFLLTTDWLKMNEGCEEKLAHKRYENGDVTMLLIQKFTDENGSRKTPPKEELPLEQYRQGVLGSLQCIKKIRYELKYIQNNIEFSITYDVFIGSELRILEVDANTEAERNTFDPDDFICNLTEVTGQREYYGYRIADII